MSSGELHCVVQSVMAVHSCGICNEEMVHLGGSIGRLLFSFK